MAAITQVRILVTAGFFFLFFFFFFFFLLFFFLGGGGGVEGVCLFVLLIFVVACFGLSFTLHWSLLFVSVCKFKLCLLIAFI